MKIKKALQTVVDHADKTKAVNYAVNYAKAALEMNEGSHEFDVQVLYVLTNIHHWRGPVAKEVRKVIKQHGDRINAI